VLYLVCFLVSVDVCAISMVSLQLTGLSPVRTLKQVSLQSEDGWALLFKCILPVEFGWTSAGDWSFICREYPNFGMRVYDHPIRLNVAVSSLLCTGKFPIWYSVMFAAYSVVLSVFLRPPMAVNEAKAGSSVSLHNHNTLCKIYNW
jgi:hypothetical protein